MDLRLKSSLLLLVPIRIHQNRKPSRRTHTNQRKKQTQFRNYWRLEVIKSQREWFSKSSEDTKLSFYDSRLKNFWSFLPAICESKANLLHSCIGENFFESGRANTLILKKWSKLFKNCPPTILFSAFSKVFKYSP